MPCKELVSVLVLHVQVRHSAGDLLPVVGSIRVLGGPGGTLWASHAVPLGGSGLLPSMWPWSLIRLSKGNEKKHG